MRMSDRFSFSIRRAGVEDAAAVRECMAAAFEPFREEYTPEAFGDTVPVMPALERRLEAMKVFVAIADDGEVIGTIACQDIGDGEGHLRGMAVRPYLHGHGVAAQLLKAAEVELEAGGCDRITLDTTRVLLRAISFYERSGYRRSGVIRDFFGMELLEYIKPLHPRSDDGDDEER